MGAGLRCPEADIPHYLITTTLLPPTTFPSAATSPPARSSLLSPQQNTAHHHLPGLRPTQSLLGLKSSTAGRPSNLLLPRITWSLPGKEKGRVVVVAVCSWSAVPRLLLAVRVVVLVSRGNEERQPCLLRCCVLRLAVAGRGRRAGRLVLEDT